MTAISPGSRFVNPLQPKNLRRYRKGICTARITVTGCPKCFPEINILIPILIPEYFFAPVPCRILWFKDSVFQCNQGRNNLKRGTWRSSGYCKIPIIYCIPSARGIIYYCCYIQPIKIL